MITKVRKTSTGVVIIGLCILSLHLQPLAVYKMNSPSPLLDELSMPKSRFSQHQPQGKIVKIIADPMKLFFVITPLIIGDQQERRGRLQSIFRPQGRGRPFQQDAEWQP